MTRSETGGKRLERVDYKPAKDMRDTTKSGENNRREILVTTERTDLVTAASR